MWSIILQSRIIGGKSCIGYKGTIIFCSWKAYLLCERSLPIQVAAVFLSIIKYNRPEETRKDIACSVFWCFCSCSLFLILWEVLRIHASFSLKLEPSLHHWRELYCFCYNAWRGVTTLPSIPSLSSHWPHSLMIS